MSDLMSNLMKLYGRLDQETVTLFGRFLVQALRSDNANAWVKEKLREMLGDISKPPITVEVRNASKR